MEDVSGWTLEKREEFLKEVFEKRMGKNLDLTIQRVFQK